MPIHQTLVRTFSAIALLAFTFASPAAAKEHGSTPAVATTAVVDAASKIRIENFGRISPTYYRGAQPMGNDYADLAALGVKTVINLTSDDAQADEEQLVEQAGMKYLQIPMTTRTAPTDEELATFLAVVKDSATGPVYVHCVGGKHRTGVMTAVYRMTASGWSGDQAFKEMKQYKFGADFLHPEFKKFVYAFHPAAPLAPAPSTVRAANAAN